LTLDDDVFTPQNGAYMGRNDKQNHSFYKLFDFKPPLCSLFVIYPMTKLSRISEHVTQLKQCRLCPKMAKPVVSGGAVASPILLVGQAPGPKEPIFGKPFAWTAGKTLFRWFRESCGVEEEIFRRRVYMAAVCRCFPGKNPAGGDRVPDDTEIRNCARWLDAEIGILKPRLVIPVGKLAILQFYEFQKLNQIIGKSMQCERAGVEFELLPLPHPSGASPWHRVGEGKVLLGNALKLLKRHDVFREVFFESK